MKNNKNVEMHIYELLGVKVFKKMAFGLYKIIGFPFTIFMSKEKRKKFYSTPNNYNMKKGHGIKDLRDFKKMLLLNTCIHIWALYSFISEFPNIFGGSASFSTTIYSLIAVGINCYCIMLQRYNHIRINQTIKRMKPREEAMKSKLKTELVKKDSLLLEHSYKIVDKKQRETNINFEDLIDNASVNQLKQYRDYLAHFQSINQSMKESDFNSDDYEDVVSMPLGKNKSLKLELKPNKHNSAATK